MLSNADKHFIEQNRLLTTEVLSKETGRKVKEIEEYLKTLPELSDEEKKKQEEQGKHIPFDKKSRVLKQMTSTDTPGVTIMTPGVSKQLDSMAKTTAKQEHIYRPHE